MADHGPSYGLDADLEKKRKEQYDPELEAQAFAWVAEVSGESVTSMDDLKNGKILCGLINKLKPGTIKSIGKANAPFVMMENIGNFLKGCQAVGVPSPDLFQTVDLYEQKNTNQVTQCIIALGRQARNISGYTGPTIGAKLSDKNERNFTEEQLKQSESIAPKISQGSHGNATQSGQYDTSRDIVKGPGAREKNMGKNN